MSESKLLPSLREFARMWHFKTFRVFHNWTTSFNMMPQVLITNAIHLRLSVIIKLKKRKRFEIKFIWSNNSKKRDGLGFEVHFFCEYFNPDPDWNMWHLGKLPKNFCNELWSHYGNWMAGSVFLHVEIVQLRFVEKLV